MLVPCQAAASSRPNHKNRSSFFRPSVEVQAAGACRWHLPAPHHVQIDKGGAPPRYLRERVCRYRQSPDFFLPAIDRFSIRDRLPCCRMLRPCRRASAISLSRLFGPTLALQKCDTPFAVHRLSSRVSSPQLLGPQDLIKWGFSNKNPGSTGFRSDHQLLRTRMPRACALLSHRRGLD
jgi:hypothetical protein